jgi:hypothetical protein
VCAGLRNPQPALTGLVDRQRADQTIAPPRPRWRTAADRNIQAARSIYRTSVDRYPGRLIMLCDGAQVLKLPRTSLSC